MILALWRGDDEERSDTMIQSVQTATLERRTCCSRKIKKTQKEARKEREVAEQHITFFRRIRRLMHVIQQQEIIEASQIGGTDILLVNREKTKRSAVKITGYSDLYVHVKYSDTN